MENNSGWKGKYPDQVYHALKINTTEWTKCSDMMADAKLCKSNRFFMESPSGYLLDDSPIEYSPENFWKKTTSQDKNFYKAKNQKSCIQFDLNVSRCKGLRNDIKYMAFLQQSQMNNPEAFTNEGISPILDSL